MPFDSYKKSVSHVNLFPTFIDLTKAVDIVGRKGLWENHEDIGMF